ncbi:MAG: MotA/TolQ/ExbB proton channel family protein [Isosphaeraceae bacterium]
MVGVAGWLAWLVLVAPARAQEGAEAGDVETSTNFLRLLWDRAGVIEIVIGAMSFYLIALVVWMAFQYRRPVVVPGVLLRDVTELLSGKRFGEAYQRLTTDDSVLARVLAAGVRKLPSGHAAAIRAMELANDDETMEMEHRTTYLATVGTLGPMIGLVGTVYGMILSFRVIATAGSSPQASALAAGISTALFATLEGIAISIPAIYFYAVFRNRIARLSLEVALAAESLLEQFSPGVRSTSIHPLAVAAMPAGSSSGVAPGGYPPPGPSRPLPPVDRPGF